MDSDTRTSNWPAPYLETQQTIAELATALTVAGTQAALGQWRVLNAAPGDDPTGHAIIDPEALLLVSLWLIPREPTLEPLVHDWVARWSDLLSVQRTRNLAKGFPVAIMPALRAVAITAHERGKDFRWSPVINDNAASITADLETRSSARDARLPAGLTRLPVERDALLVLRFRMAFGVGARADALAYLLARGSAWSTVTEIAQATGYTTSAIRRALDRMAEAEIVMMVDDGTTRYRCDASPWATLLGLRETLAPWRYWLQHFTFVASVVEWADSTARRKLTGYTITEGLRSVARGFRPTDDRDGLRRWDHAFRDGSSLPEMQAALASVAKMLLQDRTSALDQ